MAGSLSFMTTVDSCHTEATSTSTILLVLPAMDSSLILASDVGV